MRRSIDRQHAVIGVDRFLDFEDVAAVPGKARISGLLREHQECRFQSESERCAAPDEKFPEMECGFQGVFTVEIPVIEHIRLDHVGLIVIVPEAGGAGERGDGSVRSLRCGEFRQTFRFEADHLFTADTVHGGLDCRIEEHAVAGKPAGKIRDGAPPPEMADEQLFHIDMAQHLLRGQLHAAADLAAGLHRAGRKGAEGLFHAVRSCFCSFHANFLRKPAWGREFSRILPAVSLNFSLCSSIVDGGAEINPADMENSMIAWRKRCRIRN